MKPGRLSSKKAASTGRSNNKAVIALAVMGTLVLLYGWNSLFLSSKGKAKTAVQKELAAARTSEQALRANLAQLRKLAADTKTREIELARLGRLIPADTDLAGAIRALDATAKEAQVAWSTFTPAPPAAAAGGPAAIGLTIRVGGTFHQILDYLHRLETLDRLVVVDSIGLTAGSSTIPGAPTLEADLKARMFTAARAPASTGSPAAVAAAPAGGAGATPDSAALQKDGQ